MKSLFIAFIKFYQMVFSPFLGNRCRFWPSCSEYGIEAFQKFPIHKALWYLTRRIFKCHPFHRGGVDSISK